MLAQRSAGVRGDASNREHVNLAFARGAGLHPERVAEGGELRIRADGIASGVDAGERSDARLAPHGSPSRANGMVPSAEVQIIPPAGAFAAMHLWTPPSRSNAHALPRNSWLAKAATPSLKSASTGLRQAQVSDIPQIAADETS